MFSDVDTIHPSHCMQSSRDELFLPVAVGPARPRNASASRAGGPCEFYEATDRKDRRPWSRGRRPDVIDDDNVAASRTIDDAILTQPPRAAAADSAAARGPLLTVGMNAERPRDRGRRRRRPCRRRDGPGLLGPGRSFVGPLVASV